MLWYERAVVGTVVALGAAAIANAAGCGRSDDVAGGPPPTTTSGAGGGGGGSFGPDIVDFVPCAETTSQATLVPVNMFVAVDKSGSMVNDMKWENTKAAFISFFQTADVSHLRVALRFWPDDPTCTGANCCIGTVACDGTTVMCPAGECDATACGTPQVPLGSLSDAGHRQALIDLFNMTMPDGATPMSAALEGAILWANGQLMDAPDEKVVILLVTDGEPHFCNEDTAYISGLAGDAFSSAQILTYAVGLEGSQEPFMNEIATAGGTADGYFIGSGNAEQDLLNALLDIAGKSADCSFAVPAPAAGEVLDPKLVRIEYNASIMNHVENAGACGADGGWYYDNNATPTEITLCPETCNVVQADAMAQIDIALGCECEVNEDCPAGLICVDHHCRPPCQVDSDCPDGHVCIDGQCFPQPGDPCENDTQCPAGLVCRRGQCEPDGRIYVGPYEAVQGGAFTCSTDPGRRGSLAWLAALAGLFVATRRRRAR